MLNRKVVGRLKSRSNEILFSIELVVAESGLSMWLPNTTLAEDTFPQEIRRDLADPTANIPGPINILLGAGIWALIMKEGAFTNAVGMAFQPSSLGWLIFGGGSNNLQTNVKAAIVMLSEHKPEDHMDLILRQFWEIETTPAMRIRTYEQERCEEIFMQTYRRFPDGRFQVNIPFKKSLNQLGSTRAVALRRFHNLERRLQRDPELGQLYCSTMKALIDSDQMRLVSRPPSSLCYYIPPDDAKKVPNCIRRHLQE